ncbi:WLM domain-containing protein [Hyaloraphidium curvatum]|nr:WLM domain-containing protein [Hyaloraphidium curvatum]
MAKGGKDSAQRAPPGENKYKDIIGSFSTLGKHNDEEAAAILRKIASQVRPIMKKRGWFVGALKEFYPANHSLHGLNVNRGQQILLRLRHGGDEKSFYDFDHCLGTMLHELVHIVRGPHDAQFYKLLDELNKEYDGLLASGFKGDGFDAPGKRVGEGVSHDPPPHLARQKAVEAAQKRLRYNGWIGTAQSGQKLGGSSDLKSLERVYNPGQLAAMAAEKRAAQDRIWCGSDEHEHSGNDGAGEPVQASASSASLPAPARNPSPAADERDGDQGGKEKEEPARAKDRLQPKGAVEVISLDSDDEGAVYRPPPKPRPESGQQTGWSCAACTLRNPATKTRCDACDSLRPGLAATPANKPAPSLATGWYCPNCLAHNPDDRFRMCSACQFVRSM